MTYFVCALESKTSSHFDSTAKHPDWLGGETEEIQTLAAGTAI
jgi:hypothetical protein